MKDQCLPGLDLPVPLEDSVLSQSQLADLVWVNESYSPAADRWFHLKMRQQEVGSLLSMLHSLFEDEKGVGKSPRGKARGNPDSPLCMFTLAVLIDSLESQLMIDAEIERLPVDDI